MASLFRLNPRRCIHVTGEIGPETLARLAPEIVRLQDESRDPITAYIDSPGGSVRHAQQLLAMLRSPTQDGGPPCRIITAVTNLAASAAAVMLCEGDYSVAYPNALIHFHGIRYRTGDDVTAEMASDMTDRLRLSNHQAALALANRCFERLTFQYVSWRARGGEAGFEQFLAMLKAECEAKDLVVNAERRTRQYRTLVETASGELQTAASGTPGTWAPEPAEIEASVLRSLIGAQLSAHRGQGWTFADGGLGDLTHDFYLVMEYINVASAKGYERVSNRWGELLLADAERDEIGRLPEGEQPAARQKRAAECSERELRPLWLFEAGLCHELQVGEHPVPVADACRLGMIDEEFGGGATTLRDLFESAGAKQPPAGDVPA